MKTNIMKTLAAGIVATLVITSCSLEKRHYTSGYSVQWNSKKANVSATEASYVAKQTPKTEAKKVTENKTVAQAPVEQVATNNNTVTKTLVASVNKAVYTTTASKTTSFENTVANNNAKIVAKVATANTAKKAAKGDGADLPVALYIILAIIIPWVAVGLATNWGIETLWNFLWCFLCIAGIIHAFIILKRKGII